MRTIEVDQFEFDDPSTEEHLEIAVAPRGNFPFPDVERFMSARFASVAGEKPLLGDVVAFSDALGYGLVRRYLKRFGAFPCPKAVRGLPTFWNMALIGGRSSFVRLTRLFTTSGTQRHKSKGSKCLLSTADSAGRCNSLMKSFGRCFEV